MNAASRRRVVLAQLPIPPLGPDPIRGNVPLAGAYLKLYAEKRGLGAFYDLMLLPASDANTLGDQALVERLLACSPWLIGFTCYVWNIERTLWLAQQIKQRRPDIRIVLGGPEITADNAWVLETPWYDFAVIGEGEQTFAQLLLGLLGDDVPPVAIPGLYVPPPTGPRFDFNRQPAFRTPLPDLNQLGSPYVAGILDAAEEQMLLLETTRGCVFRCKFCYYPKAYDKQYYLAEEPILANLRHTTERGAREVFLLDPTLNQRRDFADLLRLLARGNPDRQFTYFGELRGEGITPETARLLRAANFTEVEVGLQSIDSEAQRQMDRKNNLRALECGIRAMLDEGIRVKVDLIIGLPGDTADSIRRGLEFLHERDLCTDLQVFNLSILPGTAFRHEAAQLGLRFQPRPPYYVLETPNLRRQDMFQLMEEAQSLFAIEFDALPPPVLPTAGRETSATVLRVDLDRASTNHPADPAHNQAFTLWFESQDFSRHLTTINQVLDTTLRANPFTTLQIVLDVKSTEVDRVPQCLPVTLLEGVLACCQSRPSYLDRYYGLQPGRPLGAKRLIVLLPITARAVVPQEWLSEISWIATVVWRGVDGALILDEEMEPAYVE